MAYGPGQTQPVGTYKNNRIKALCRYIDKSIESTEGNLVVVNKQYDWPLYWDIKKDIIDIYKLAGWKHVYWLTDSLYDHERYDDMLVLCNDEYHLLKIHPNVSRRYNWNNKNVFQKIWYIFFLIKIKVK